LDSLGKRITYEEEEEGRKEIMEQRLKAADSGLA